MNINKTHCGFVAIVGRSNVGKSTLLNKLIGQKISITSHKIYTTQCCIFGIRTEEKYQTIYIDTPGVYRKKRKNTSKFIDKMSRNIISDVELIIFVVEGTYWTQDDEIVMEELHKKKIPVILAINKINNIQKKERLLPHLQFLAKKMNFLDIIPISAKTGMNINIILDIVHKNLPEAVHLFPRKYLTNCSKHFRISEIIREKLIYLLGNELPYLTTVEIKDFFVNEHGGYNVNGLIFVKRTGQKKIVIGKNGKRIRIIGSKARKDIQSMLKAPVYLKLQVKVKSV